jgi:hypothetical protein
MNKHEIQSLGDKLRQFAGELTPEEQEQLRTIRMRMQDVTGMLSPSLWDKAQAAVEALTPAEAAELSRVLGGAVGAAAGSDVAEVTGYAIAEYEDAYGYKGKIGTGGESAPPAGSGLALGQLAGYGVAGLLVIATVLYPGGRIAAGEFAARDANAP